MTKLAVILGVPIALIATVASLGVVVVDVREGGPDGNRIVVPVPLVFAQARSRVAPRGPGRDADPRRGAEHVGLARGGPGSARRGPTASSSGSRTGTSSS
jgi:hypothetical protein